jgi:hypothetical protein
MKPHPIMFRLPPEIFAALEAYRARNGLRSLNAAVIHLIEEMAK